MSYSHVAIQARFSISPSSVTQVQQSVSLCHRISPSTVERDFIAPDFFLLVPLTFTFTLCGPITSYCCCYNITVIYLICETASHLTLLMIIFAFSLLECYSPHPKSIYAQLQTVTEPIYVVLQMYALSYVCVYVQIVQL